MAAIFIAANVMFVILLANKIVYGRLYHWVLFLWAV